MSYFKSTTELWHFVGKLDYIYPSFFYLSLQHCNSSYEFNLTIIVKQHVTNSWYFECLGARFREVQYIFYVYVDILPSYNFF